MKREILFRGLRVNGQGWIYGDLNHIDGKTYIFTRDGLHLDSTDSYEVNPETVGQFTGVTDCDDRKVFEGDIINYNLQGFLLIVEFIGACFVLSGPNYPIPMRGTTTQGRIIRNIHE